MSSKAIEREEEILNCRFLQDNEYFRLEELFRVHNDQLPNPNLSKIAIVEREVDKEIIGFFCLQLYAHSEPLWIKDEYRHLGLWTKLTEMIWPLTKESKTFVIAATEATEIMCQRLGLRKLESPVYVKDTKS